MRKLTVIIIFILLTTAAYTNSAEVGPNANDTSAIAEIAIEGYTIYGRTPTNKEFNELIFYFNLSSHHKNPNAPRIPYAFPCVAPITTVTEDNLSLEHRQGIWEQFNYSYWDALDFFQDTGECDCDTCLKKQVGVAVRESIAYTATLVKEYFPRVNAESVIKQMNALNKGVSRPHHNEHEVRHKDKTPQDIGHFAINESHGYGF